MYSNVIFCITQCTIPPNVLRIGNFRPHSHFHILSILWPFNTLYLVVTMRLVKEMVESREACGIYVEYPANYPYSDWWGVGCISCCWFWNGFWKLFSFHWSVGNTLSYNEKLTMLEDKKKRKKNTISPHA